MQTIFIRDFELYGFHGVYAKEKREGQRFLINVEADIDTEGRKTDKIEETLNYEKLCAFITKYFMEVNKNLLENLVEDLETEILQQFSQIQKIEIEVGKPDVDMPYHFSNIGIRSEKRWHRIYLGLGSNMGSRSDYLRMAVSKLQEHPALTNVRVSTVIETKPYGYLAQEDFLNSVVEADTYLDPYELLTLCHEIENSAARVREIHWGPRTLDLDILLYDDLILSMPDLCIPHADMQNRSFVLDPLCELNPYAYHPVLRKRAGELREELQNGKHY